MQEAFLSIRPDDAEDSRKSLRWYSLECHPAEDPQLRMETNHRDPWRSVPANYRPGDGESILETFEGDDSIRANSTPALYPSQNNDRSDEPMDALAMLCQQYCRDNNIDEVKFDPSAKVLNPNSGAWFLVWLSVLDQVCRPVLDYFATSARLFSPHAIARGFH